MRISSPLDSAPESARFRAAASPFCAVLRPAIVHVGQVMDEAVPTAELLCNRCNEPLVEALAGGSLPGERFVALGRRGLLERRGMHDHPESQKASEGLRQELEVAVLTLTLAPVVVDSLSEPVKRARYRSIL